jgi:hypothetical protein
MDAIEKKCIEIFKKIEWQNVGKGEEYDKYIDLFFEFLRRTSIFAKQNNITSNVPWSVITELLPKDFSVSDETEKIIEGFSYEARSRVYVSIALFCYTLFEKARGLGIVSAEEKNIYSPLIKMFMLTGCFHSHHGEIEFNNLMQIHIRDQAWMRTDPRVTPYIEFDDNF